MRNTPFITLIWLLLLPSAQAASFDCAKAVTKVEKLVCDNPKISKLDDELGKAYQEALHKANEEQKKLLVTEQKHWLKQSRNVCSDETCLKLAYWSRQAGLATFFEPKSPLYKHEADKAEAIKKVLATAPLYLSEGVLDAPFCNQMFDDLKQMKVIRFVDPVVQTQSYEDPALDKWKQYCGTKPPLHFSFGCEPRVSANIDSYKDALETPACSKGFGLPPYKIYELPPAGLSGKNRHIFYTDDHYGSEVWEYGDGYTVAHWEAVKPQLGRGGFAGFRQINLEKCVPESEIFSDAGQGRRNGKNYNSIIEYKNHNYFFVLNDNNSPSWWLDVHTVARNGSKEMKSCRWSPVAPKSNSSDQGRK